VTNANGAVAPRDAPGRLVAVRPLAGAVERGGEPAAVGLADMVGS